MTILAPRHAVAVATLTLLSACAGSRATPTAATTAALEPLQYTIRIPAPATKTFDVQVVVPTSGRDSVVLMMPIWSPGMYALQSYGDRVTAFSARGSDGSALSIAHPN